MLKKFALSLTIFGSVMHIFCCGLPLVLSLASLATMIGVSTAKIIHISWFVESMQSTILIVSGVILTISILAQYISSRIDCNTDGKCSHKPCGKKKSFSDWLLIVAIFIYIINLLIFLLKN